MKKFLPLIIFILVFSAVIVGQVAWQAYASAVPTKANSQYAAYEQLFLKGSFETIEGKKIEITKIKSPIVIYNFWASWCGPCIEEMPSLISMKKKFKDEDVQVMSFNTDETDQLKNIQKTLRKFNLKNEFNIIPDKNTKIAEGFRLSAIPVTIIFNRGKVVYFSNGPMDFDSSEMIEKLKKWIKD